MLLQIHWWLLFWKSLYLLKRPHWKRAQRQFQSCFDVITTYSIVFTDHKQDWRMSVWNFALNEETSPNKKLASSLHRRQWNAFFFFSIFYLPNENKAFICAVQMVPSCGLTVYFLPSFFLFLIKVKEKKNPRRGKPTKTTKQNMEGWRIMWKNIWIQNLSEGVDRFFFLTENMMSRGGQTKMETSCFPW